MTAPTPAPPNISTLPPAPPTTPAALIRIASAVLILVGPALDLWNPWHITSSMAKALIILAFVAVGGVLLVVHEFIIAQHKSGWTLETLRQTWAASQTAVDADIAQFKGLWPTVQPLLAKVPDAANVVDHLTAIEAKVNAIPVTDRNAVIQLIEDNVVPLALAKNTQGGQTPS